MEISYFITPGFVDNAMHAYENRFYYCLYVRGTHFEHLLRKYRDVDDALNDDVDIELLNLDVN